MVVGGLEVLDDSAGFAMGLGREAVDVEYCC
jgi:hypothetical protein